MPVWRHCYMSSFHATADEKTEIGCEVRIVGKTIAVSYDDEAEDGPSVYEGSETSPCHFKLELPRKKGRAALHQAPGSDFLEGFWIESRYEGMWRIQLNDEP
jgi:hypothetical protein